MVEDYLCGYLVCRVGHRLAFVVGQLRADNHESVPLVFREVDADAAPTTSGRGVDVIGNQVHGANDTRPW